MLFLYSPKVRPRVFRRDWGRRPRNVRQMWRSLTNRTENWMSETRLRSMTRELNIINDLMYVRGWLTKIRNEFQNWKKPQQRSWEKKETDQCRRNEPERDFNVIINWHWLWSCKRLWITGKFMRSRYYVPGILLKYELMRYIVLSEAWVPANADIMRSPCNTE